MFAAIAGTLFQCLLYMGLAPGVTGLLAWMEARLQGRAGPSPLQRYRDLWKMFHRRPVVPQTASWVFTAAPWVVFSCYVLLGILTPIVFLVQPENRPAQSLIAQLFGWPVSDLIVLVYLLGLDTFVRGLAGMDAGSPLGALGSSREMLVHFLAEPTLLLVVFALALKVHTTSLPGILAGLQSAAKNNLGGFYLNPSLWMIFLALALVALAESGRLPFSNPAAKPELTMVGKVAQLEYGGPSLALLEWAEAMRLTFFLTLLLNVLFPYLLARQTTSVLNAALVILYPVRLCLGLCVLALWEMLHGKLRLGGVPGPATLAVLFSAFAVVVAALFPG